MPRFWQDEQGQGLVEYALILAVISITILIELVFFKDQLSTHFSSIGNNLTKAAARQPASFRGAPRFDIVLSGPRLRRGPRAPRKVGRPPLFLSPELKKGERQHEP